MNKYELLLVIDRDATDEKREELINRFKSMIDGEVVSLDKWGMKKFAYPINFKNEGFYLVMTFTTSNASLVSEMGNLLNITDGIVRYLFVRK
ncbi:MAG: 30S ribosomal protein S6 [Christensenellales bacterium]|jgi:small subunit ribosomal protein S6